MADSPKRNWETGQVYQLVNKNITLMQDVVEGNGQSAVSAANLDSSDWDTFKNTLISNYNTWWDDSNSAPFTVPVPKRTNDSFSSWQSATGQDKQSSWKDPATNPGAACWAQPDMSDYWLVVSYTSNIVTVSPGQTATWTAYMVPLNFTGTAQLSYDGVKSISGATASWSSNSVAQGGSSTLSVTTKSSTPAGTYPITMIASSGSIMRTVTVLLTVQ